MENVIDDKNIEYLSMKDIKKEFKMDFNMSNNYKDFHDSRQIFINDK
jgi:hypothetical protein